MTPPAAHIQWTGHSCNCKLLLFYSKTFYTCYHHHLSTLTAKLKHRFSPVCAILLYPWLSLSSTYIYYQLILLRKEIVFYLSQQHQRSTRSDHACGNVLAKNTISVKLNNKLFYQKKCVYNILYTHTNFSLPCDAFWGIIS